MREVEVLAPWLDALPVCPGPSAPVLETVMRSSLTFSAKTEFLAPACEPAFTPPLRETQEEVLIRSQHVSDDRMSWKLPNCIPALFSVSLELPGDGPQGSQDPCPALPVASFTNQFLQLRGYERAWEAFQGCSGDRKKAGQTSGPSAWSTTPTC